MAEVALQHSSVAKQESSQSLPFLGRDADVPEAAFCFVQLDSGFLG